MTPERIKELRDTEYASDPFSQKHRQRLTECLDEIERLRAALEEIVHEHPSSRFFRGDPNTRRSAYDLVDIARRALDGGGPKR